MEATKISGLTEDSSASSEVTETVHIPFFATRHTLPGAKNPMTIATSVVELDPKEASKSRSGSHQKSGLTEDISASSEGTETVHIPLFASRHTLPGAKKHMSIATSVVELESKETSKSRSGSHQKFGLTEDSSASSEATETVHIPFFASRHTLPGAKKPHVDSYLGCRARFERSFIISLWKPPKIRFKRG